MTSPLQTVSARACAPVAHTEIAFTFFRTTCDSRPRPSGPPERPGCSPRVPATAGSGGPRRVMSDSPQLGAATGVRPRPNPLPSRERCRRLGAKKVNLSAVLEVQRYAARADQPYGLRSLLSRRLAQAGE
jgi:hypothetical protein